MASIGSWPTTFRVKNCRFEPRFSQIANASPFGGSEQVFDRLNDRWMAYLTLSVEYFAGGATLEAFLASFRGQVNTVNLWHFARPQPRGTLRGTLVTSGSQAQGATQLVLSGGTAGGTLLKGDMLGPPNQLVQVSADCTADGSGNITVPVVNRLRAAIATGQAVAWDKPAVPFRLLSHSPLTYEAGMIDEVQCVLAEAIT